MSPAHRSQVARDRLEGSLQLEDARKQKLAQSHRAPLSREARLQAFRDRLEAQREAAQKRLARNASSSPSTRAPRPSLTPRKRADLIFRAHSAAAQARKLGLKFQESVKNKNSAIPTAQDLKDVRMSRSANGTEDGAVLKAMMARSTNIVMDFCKHQPQCNKRLEQLVSRLCRHRLRAGDYLFKIDDSGTAMFLVCAGELTCMTRDVEEARTLTAGMQPNWP